MRCAEMSVRAAVAVSALAMAGCDSVGSRPPAPVPAAVAAAAAASAAASEQQQAYGAALDALRGGRDADARRMLLSLLQRDPDLAGPHANLGVIARRAGDLPQAIAELEKAVALDPKLPQAWNQLGLSYRAQGRFEDARQAYEHALSLDPGLADVVLNLGVLEDTYLGHDDRALELYARYLALTPNGDAMVDKWIAELRRRKPSPATADNTVLKKQP